MTAIAQTREEVLAELEAERTRQANQRVLVANAAWDMLDQLGDDAPCTNGVNEFLRQHGIPEIDDEEENLDQAALRAAALNLVTYGFDPEEYTAAGLQRRLEPLRQQGAAWLRTFIEALQGRAASNDIPARLTDALIRQLRGEPAPVTQDQSAASAVRLPRAERGYTDVAMQVTFAIRIPSRNTSGASDAVIRQHAEDGIRQAVQNQVRNSQFGAQLANPVQFTTAVQRG